MCTSITGLFETRRDAEMAVERLVQEFDVERSDIFIAAEGAQNSAGVEVDGSDSSTIPPGEEARNDGAHAGGVQVSVDVNNPAAVEEIVSAFDEFDGATKVDK
ncbi:hypothetical protein [Sphingomonas sp. AX6]|uniref:hypothetical protein n=1 Tax=Sphingomonas sp. AX6 TaxID=2653171 RepID=UPI0012F3385B|nr:hypothetical protein [Sphingomonas sp. AX6]VXC98528.1 conserved hypothetical protein [Sphingomonas sp. AX6]